MSAIRLPLSAGLYSRKQGDIQTSDFPPPICHPERSEGSRYKALVSLSLVNTGRREDIRLSDARHQTYIHYSRMQGGGEAPSAPGFYGSCALRRTMGFPRRAGRFRGSYVCCLRQRPMSESEYNLSTQPAAKRRPFLYLRRQPPPQPSGRRLVKL
mgnify:CR=1 FL=1